MTERVRVVVRIRPFIPSDPADAELNTIVLDDTHLRVSSNHVFKVDRVFMMEDESRDIYQETVAPLVDRFISGCNASVLAYGQTGTGKTYTVQAMLPLLLTQVLQSPANPEPAKQCKSSSLLESRPRLQLQYVEVYGETIRDLLEDPKARLDSTKQNKLRLVTATTITNIDTTTGAAASIPLSGGAVHGSCVVAGATIKPICSVKDAAQLIALGDTRRATGATNVHEHSSRSHAILTLFHPRYACRFDVVDLAGSEREKKTGNTGLRFQESIAINTGLLALGNVIRALSRNHRTALAREASTNSQRTAAPVGIPTTATGALHDRFALNAAVAPRAEGNTAQHVPYRSSKLTRLLQDTLGGSSATLFIACVAPDSYNRDETLRTLQYCSLALQVLNEPVRQYDRLQCAQSRDCQRNRQRNEQVRSGGNSSFPLHVASETEEDDRDRRAIERNFGEDTSTEARFEEVQAAYALLRQQYDEQSEVLASICESYAEAKDRLEMWEKELRKDEGLFTQQIRVMQQLVQENQKLRHRFGKMKATMERKSGKHAVNVAGRRYCDVSAGVRGRDDFQKDLADIEDTSDHFNVQNETASLLHTLPERCSAVHSADALKLEDSEGALALCETLQAAATTATAAPPPVSALSPYRHLNFKSRSILEDSQDNSTNQNNVGAGARSTATSEPVQSFIRSLLRQHGIFTGRHKHDSATASNGAVATRSVGPPPPPTEAGLVVDQCIQEGVIEHVSSLPTTDHVHLNAGMPSPSSQQFERNPRIEAPRLRLDTSKSEQAATASMPALEGSAPPHAIPYDHNSPERDVQLLQLAHEVLRYEEINTDLRNQVRLLQAKLDDKAREAARLRLEVQEMKDVYSSLSAITDAS